MSYAFAIRAAVLACLTTTALAQNQAGPQPEATGPMRVECVSIFDTRIQNFIELSDVRQSAFQINARLIGPRIEQIIRLGTPIVEEMVDSTGLSMVDPSMYTLAQRDRTRQYSIPQGAISQGFINMRIPVATPASRAATSITRTRGYLWVVFGGEAEPIFLTHPMQYRGKYIDHPRLEELGIRIRMLTPEEAPETRVDDKTFALDIETGEDMVRNITVYDDWLRNTNTRVKPIREKDRRLNIYSMVTGRFHDDCELGIYVYPRVERLKVDFEWLNLELP